MPCTLQNQLFNLQIDLPNENYKSSRFDWTGKIVNIAYKGIKITSHELPDKDTPDQGLGLYNEFGIDQPLGFKEAAVGDWFHKIGVGLLQKQGPIYDFNVNYKIRPAHFQVHSEANRITTSCTSSSAGGYAYLLKKEIQLNEHCFVISYELTNTGDKDISTNEYVHNFIAFNDQPIKETYSLDLPFKTEPSLFIETINPEKLATIGERCISFLGQPSKPFFFSNLTGGMSVNAQWTLVNKQQKMSLSEIGSFKTSLVNLWGWNHVISPELFFQVNAKPCESIAWARRYTVNELQ